MVSIAIFGLMNSFDFWLRRREVYHITVMRKFSPLVSIVVNRVKYFREHRVLGTWKCSQSNICQGHNGWS